MKPRDSATVTTVVAVDPAMAFAVFTEEVDAWWKRGARFRFGGTRTGVMRFEPRVGGRLLEVFDEAAGDVHEAGRVRVWQPPHRLVFEFRGLDLRPGESTEVEVRFAPEGDGTRVTVEHRGWSALPPDHPARHGLGEPSFTSLLGLWWAELLVGLRARSAARAQP